MPTITPNVPSTSTVKRRLAFTILRRAARLSSRTVSPVRTVAVGVGGFAGGIIASRVLRRRAVSEAPAQTGHAQEPADSQDAVAESSLTDKVQSEIARPSDSVAEPESAER